MTKPEPGPLRTITLRDRVIEIVRQALVSGEIRPGDMYSAAALASRLGVSTSPVREALLTLVSEGLMEPVRNRGYRVVPMTGQDLDEIYQMRLLLEVPATLAAAERATEQDIAHLETLAARIETAARGRNVTKFLEADRHFHISLLALCGNKRLVDTVATLRNYTRLYGLDALAQRGQLTDSALEHRGILEAIIAKDPVELERVMREHLHHVRSDWADSETATTPANSDDDRSTRA